MNKSAVSLLLLAAAAPAWPAGAAATLSDKLAACATIPDSAQRLICFDQLAALAVASAPAIPGSATTAPPASTAQNKPVESAPAAIASAALGDDDLHKKQGTPEDAPEVHAKITRLANAGSSSFMVYLDNGQVWHHDDAYLGSFLQTGEAVTITRGALGSYRMTRDESKARNWIRVSRVR